MISSPHDLLLVIGLAWAAIASLALAGLIWRLRSLRRRLLDLVSGNGSSPPQRSIREALAALQAIIATQQNLLTQTTQVREQLRNTTRSAEHLRQHQLAAQQLFARLDEGVFMARHDGKVLEVNPALEDMLKRPAHLMRERLLKEVLVPEDGVFFQNLCQTIDQYAHWEGRLLLRRSDRSLFPAYLRLFSLLDDAGRPQYLLGVLRDLSHMEETHAKLHQLTHQNPITGLQNRVSFLDELDALLNIDHPRRWVLMIIGIDRFAIVHDTLGLNLSHRFLQEIAKRLQQNLHSHERLAHIGDHEFALLSDMDASMSEQNAPWQRAQELLQLMQRPFELKEPRYRLSLSASIGIAQAPKDGHQA
ncbi:MAG: diguanylate cyclase, partial [Halothiobacillaceae bacterium]